MDQMASLADTQYARRQFVLFGQTAFSPAPQPAAPLPKEFLRRVFEILDKAKVGEKRLHTITHALLGMIRTAAHDQIFRTAPGQPPIEEFQILLYIAAGRVNKQFLNLARTFRKETGALDPAVHGELVKYVVSCAANEPANSPHRKAHISIGAALALGLLKTHDYKDDRNYPTLRQCFITGPARAFFGMVQQAVAARGIVALQQQAVRSDKMPRGASGRVSAVAGD
jgi:hypothetical protein